MKMDLFQSCGHCWVFQICWHIECSTFTASSFRIWNSSAGIPSPPLSLFTVMLPKDIWLHIPGCLALAEWSHHPGYQRDWESPGNLTLKVHGIWLQNSTGLGKQTRGGHKQNVLCTRTPEKAATAPQKPEPDLPGVSSSLWRRHGLTAACRGARGTERHSPGSGRT